VRRGHDADVDGALGGAAPTRSKVRSSSTRRSFTCTLAGSSPTSSRKTVPPSATLDRPFARLSAPVKAALLVAEELALEERLGSVVQSTVTKGPLARGLLRVDGAGEDALARARLAAEEDGGIDSGGARHLLVHRPHRRARPDDVVEHPAHRHPARLARGGAEGRPLQRARGLRGEELEEGEVVVGEGPGPLVEHLDDAADGAVGVADGGPRGRCG
jgi:hypothetical protein